MDVKLMMMMMELVNETAHVSSTQNKIEILCQTSDGRFFLLPHHL